MLKLIVRGTEEQIRKKTMYSLYTDKATKSLDWAWNWSITRKCTDKIIHKLKKWKLQCEVNIYKKYIIYKNKTLFQNHYKLHATFLERQSKCNQRKTSRKYTYIFCVKMKCLAYVKQSLEGKIIVSYQVLSKL